MMQRHCVKKRLLSMAVCISLLNVPTVISGENVTDSEISGVLIEIIKDIINLNNTLSFVQRRVDNTTASLQRQQRDTAAQLRANFDIMERRQSRPLDELSERLNESWENTSSERALMNERVYALERRINNISAETRLGPPSLNATLLAVFSSLFDMGLSPILSQLSQLRTAVDRIRSSFRMIAENRSALLHLHNQIFTSEIGETTERYSENAAASSIELRLVGGTDTTKGRLEVFYQGQWGLVCSSGFDDADATVACRQLGHWNGIVLSSRTASRIWAGVFSTTANQSTPIWMSDVSCNGTELYLHQCPHSGWNVTRNCSVTDDVAIRCTPLTTVAAPSTRRTTPRPTTAVAGSATSVADDNATAEQWSLRLLNPEQKRGVLQVLYNGSWGAVCISGSNDEYDAVAKLACLQLNFSTGYVQSDSGEPISEYALQDLRCIGNETSLTRCSYSTTPNDCENGETLNVQCMERLEERMRGVRLVDGHDNSSGYVQLYVNGSWGFLCGRPQLAVSGWDLHGAEVLCRQLGIIRSSPRLLSSRRRTQLSLSEVNFVADAFNCNGEEPTLKDCPRVQVPAYRSMCGSTTQHAVYAHCEPLN